jgi:hypothetical protein
MSWTISRQLQPLSQSSSQHFPSQIGYQMWTVKGTTNVILYMRAAVHVRELHHKLYHDRSIIPDWSIHNNRPDIVILDKTIQEAYLIHVAIPNSHHLYITLTKKLQKHTDLKDKAMATENGLYNTTSTIHNGYYSKQITRKFKTA